MEKFKILVLVLINLLVLWALCSCSTKIPEIGVYTLEINEEIDDPCSKVKTNLFPLHSDIVLDTIWVKGDCLFVLETVCGKKIRVPGRYEPKIFIQGTPDLPPILKHSLICSYDTSDCSCKSRHINQLDIGLFIGNRFLKKQEYEDYTYLFYDESGNIIERNIPHEWMFLLDVDYYFLTLDKDDKFRLGANLGYWHVDNYKYIPIGLNLLYLSNPYPDPLEFNCGAMPWYHCHSWRLFFGFGLPIDIDRLGGGFNFESRTKAPIFSFDSFSHQRFFMNFGLGGSLLFFRRFDLTLDLGIRYTQLPLGSIDCCPNLQDAKYKYPFRHSLFPFLRLGFSTFNF